MDSEGVVSLNLILVSFCQTLTLMIRKCVKEWRWSRFLGQVVSRSAGEVKENRWK